jgi:hypothetical protein
LIFLNSLILPWFLHLFEGKERGGRDLLFPSINLSCFLWGSFWI